MIDLIHAAQLGLEDEVKKLLSKEEININYQDRAGNTALIWAVIKNNEEIVKILLEDPKTDIHLKNRVHQTALLEALKRNRSSVVNLILEKCSLDINPSQKQDILIWAIERNLLNIIKFICGKFPDIINFSNSIHRSPLITAIIERKEEVIKILLNTKGIELNSPDFPLVLAVKIGHLEIIEALLKTGLIDQNHRQLAKIALRTRSAKKPRDIEYQLIGKLLNKY